MSSVEFLESKAGTTQEKGAAALVLLRASNHLFGLPCYEHDWCRGDRIAVRPERPKHANPLCIELENATRVHPLVVGLVWIRMRAVGEMHIVPMLLVEGRDSHERQIRQAPIKLSNADPHRASGFVLMAAP